MAKRRTKKSYFTGPYPEKKSRKFYSSKKKSWKFYKMDWKFDYNELDII